jgi:hypothetical protein
MRASSGDDYNIKRPFIIINNGLVFNILFDYCFQNVYPSYPFPL